MDPILECNGLYKNYGLRRALNGVELTLYPGKIIGLLGPNGSGKTTLIKLAAGLLQPTAGEILIAGMQPGEQTKAVVSYLPDRPGLPEWMRVGELVSLMEDFYCDFDANAAQEMLSRLQVAQSDKMKSLSKGTKEKVQLVLTMSRRARLYLLDEPIGGVDPAARDYILDTILSNYRREATVLISTHLIADLERIVDQVVLMQDGRVRLCAEAAQIREENGCSVDAFFREVYRC